MSALASSALNTVSSSERRLAANRANAQLSTGPTTIEGKAKSSLNAVKAGLTGRTVLLPSEDAALYEAHGERFQQELQPVGEREAQLVQNLADTQWRLNRIPGLEFGLFALGRKRYADQFEEEEDSQVRAALLDAHILMTEAKHFKNLPLQESRLRRQYQQDAKELRELQTPPPGSPGRSGRTYPASEERRPRGSKWLRIYKRGRPQQGRGTPTR